jgi:predicted aminopeptidase
VAVGGVAAYSTLGHFDDPILNTMVGWSDVELASSCSTN